MAAKRYVQGRQRRRFSSTRGHREEQKRGSATQVCLLNVALTLWFYGGKLGTRLRFVQIIETVILSGRVVWQIVTTTVALWMVLEKLLPLWPLKGRNQVYLRLFPLLWGHRLSSYCRSGQISFWANPFCDICYCLGIVLVPFHKDMSTLPFISDLEQK